MSKRVPTTPGEARELALVYIGQAKWFRDRARPGDETMERECVANALFARRLGHELANKAKPAHEQQTERKYNAYYHKLGAYLRPAGINPMLPNVLQVVDFYNDADGTVYTCVGVDEYGEANTPPIALYPNQVMPLFHWQPRKTDRERQEWQQRFFAARLAEAHDFETRLFYEIRLDMIRHRPYTEAEMIELAGKVNQHFKP